MRTPALAVAASCAVITAVVISLCISPKKQTETQKPAPVALPNPVAMPLSIPPNQDEASPAIQPAKPRHAIALQTAMLRQYLQEQNERPMQKIIIAGAADTSITFSGGTRINLNAASFVNARTGQPVTDPVEVKLQEYYSLNDMMMAHLTTATKDAMLETNGMININASSGGEACRLKDGKTIQVSFPIKNKKPGMELFSGEKDESGAIVWKALKINVAIAKGNENQNAGNKKAAVTDTSGEIIDTTINSWPEFPGGLKGIARNINNTKNYFPMEAPACTLIADILLNKEGQVYWVRKVKGLDDIFVHLQNALYKMPNWKPGIKKGKARLYTMRMMVFFNPRSEKLLRFLPLWPSPRQIYERDLKSFYENPFDQYY